MSKLARFDAFRLGVVGGDSLLEVTLAVADIPCAAPMDLMGALIGPGDMMVLPDASAGPLQRSTSAPNARLVPSQTTAVLLAP